MQDHKEFYGVLRGFDGYFNLILDDVREYEDTGAGGKRIFLGKMESMLLNGSHICMLIPGPKLPKAENE